jgi:hypothetical protein
MPLFENLTHASERFTEMASCPRVERVLQDLRLNESSLKLQRAVDEYRRLFEPLLFAEG